MLRKVWDFVKYPVYGIDTNEDPAYKKKVFLRLLWLNVTFSIGLGMVGAVLNVLFDLDLGEHAMDKLIAKFPIWALFVLVVIVAPFFEELVFRGPLGFFKKSRYFKYAFYVSVLAFGAIHMTNFDNIEQIVWLAPILVAPQIVGGCFLGYIRVKFGLYWSIFLHAAHNAILISPLLTLK